MEISTLYETAKYFAGMLKQKYPYLEADTDACLSLVVAESGDIFSGVSSITLSEGSPVVLPAEDIAAMSVITSGQTASQLIIITIEDNSFCEPSESALKMLVNSSPENGSCQIILSPDEVAAAASLIPNAVEDFMSGYDDLDTPQETAPEMESLDPASSLGAPAEFSEGFDIDETNPFAAAGGSASEVKSFYDQPEDAQQQGASGFNNPYAAQSPVNPQEGFPQQGYPQQGFPQQGYPQQGGFPQANPYNSGTHGSVYQHGGFPQQGGFPQATPYGTGGHSSMYQSNYGANADQARSVMLSSNGGGGAFKKRLNNFLDDEADGLGGSSENLSKEEMLKQAKERKKVAKANIGFKNKF